MSTTEMNAQEFMHFIDDAHKLIHRQRVSRNPEIPGYQLLRLVSEHRILLRSGMVNHAVRETLKSNKNGIYNRNFTRLKARLRGENGNGR